MIAAVLAVLLLGDALPPTLNAGNHSFKVTGDDTVTVSGHLQRITYDGLDQVAVMGAGSSLRFSSQASYQRGLGTSTSRHTARFTTEITADGNEHDLASTDPDEMSVLHQPFTIALDRATRMGLLGMRERIPFAFAAPIGDTDVNGTLRRITSPAGTLAVSFDASGPFSGEAPDNQSEQIDGSLHMHGTALYEAGNGVLLALHVSVEITGNVGVNHDSTAILIVHERRFEREDAPKISSASR
jgi:hypothetical protein